jgi:hypothetical protein
MSRLVLVPAMLAFMTPNACQDSERARWRYTCGDPVCMGYTVKPGIPLCTNQDVGNPCEPEGDMCDPQDECNRVLICSIEDPGVVPCPDLP